MADVNYQTPSIVLNGENGNFCEFNDTHTSANQREYVSFSMFIHAHQWVRITSSFENKNKNSKSIDIYSWPNDVISNE